MKTTTKFLFGFYLLVALSFLLPVSMRGQGWEKTFGGTKDEGARSVEQTKDGGYIVVGHSNYDNKMYIIRTDPEGDSLWTKKFVGSAESVQQTSDGGYIVAGNNGGAYLLKMDASGNMVWDKGFVGATANCVRQTIDGGYIVAGGNYNDAFLAKTDGAGNITWDKNYEGVGFTSIKQTTDGGYIVVGDYGFGMEDYHLVKTNAAGDTLWTRTFGGPGGDDALSVEQTDDGGYIIAGTTQSYGAGEQDAYLIKTDYLGDTLWTRTFGGPNADWGTSVHQTADGGYIIAGMLNMAMGDAQPFAYLVKTDYLGFKIWAKTFGGNGIAFAFSVQQTIDGGYILAGETESSGNGINAVYLIKTDQFGNTYTNHLMGRSYFDRNNNCIFDGNDIPLDYRTVDVDAGKWFATTDGDGNYSFVVDSGSHIVSQALIPNAPFEFICSGIPNNIAFSALYDSLNNVDFPNAALFNCPFLSVDIASIAQALEEPHNGYTVNYCNQGTDSATNVYIEVTFDPAIIPQSSTLPWSQVNGSTYTFNIGGLGVDQCGTFYIKDSISANATLGQTACAEAEIFPYTYCGPVDSTWDHSKVAVTGFCNTDSIVFTIMNVGSSNMAGNSKYRVYEDNVLLVAGKAFQLNKGDSLRVPVFATKKTYRLEADQRPGYPEKSKPRKSVEMCGTPTFSLGQITPVPQDDAEPNIEYDCHQIIGSYDPNGKSVQPSGVSAGHYVTREDELEYIIVFQNTGTDTAFRVVIRDTINKNVLNPATIETGGSSHPYMFKIFGQGILEWNFTNIMLPDSNVNEAASHGFVKFKIQQQPNNPEGTIIENTADIYFDYNAPVITNTPFVTIKSNPFPSEVGIGKPLSYGKDVLVSAYPNPFSDKITIEVAAGNLQTVKLELSDLMGRNVSKPAYTIEVSPHGNFARFVLSKGALGEGIYFYRIYSGNEMIGSGKMVVE